MTFAFHGAREDKSDSILFAALTSSTYPVVTSALIAAKFGSRRVDAHATKETELALADEEKTLGKRAGQMERQVRNE
jgi:hypothetical protein